MWVDLRVALRRQTTLVLVRDTEQRLVLLAMKKRGLGQGKWNGAGGKREEGESVEEAARRECEEEVGVKLEKGSLKHRGVLEFRFVDRPEWNSECHVFTCDGVSDEQRRQVAESEEMRPQWWDEKSIPYDDMWCDDRIWLPRIIEKDEANLHYRFWHSAETSQIVRYEEIN